MTSSVLLRRTLALPILLATLVACNDDDNGNGPGSGTFTLGAPAANAVTLTTGTATTVTIPLTISGNIDPVTLVADSVPAGVRVGFQPSTITSAYEQVVVSISANPDAALGTNTVKIIASAADMADQFARIAVTTQAPPTYAITSTASTTAVDIQRTQSSQIAVDIDRDGFTGPLDFVTDALPVGITVNTPSGVTGNTAMITVNTAANAQASAQSFTLRATNPTIADRTATIRIRVLAEPGVQIAMANRSVVQLSPDTMFVTVNREGGFNGPVTVALSGLPAGVAADPVTSDAGTSVAVPLDIAEDAAVGNATVTASVSGTGITTKTTTATLNVISGLLVSGTGRVVADARGRNSINIYRVVVPAGATQLAVTFAGGTGDGDVELYDSNFDYLDGSYEVDNDESLVLANPAAGTYYVVVWVWNPYAGATLTATVTTGAALSGFRESSTVPPPRSSRHPALDLKAILRP